MTRRGVVILVVGLVGCRSAGDKDSPGVDTQGLEAIGDVEAMAAAWCQLISCQQGFADNYDSVAACVSLHEDYWGNPDWSNNRRECFIDNIEATDACTAALEASPCGGPPPEACMALLTCALPNDFGR